MFSLPYVSVIIPCFNQGCYLVESVSSALSAYRGPLEVIIIDDGSTDPANERHLSEVQRLSDSVRILRQANEGLSAARNAGLEAAKGEYVQFLDADDLIAPSSIDVRLFQLRNRCENTVSISDYLVCDEEKNVFEHYQVSFVKESLSLEDFLFRWERGLSVPIHCALLPKAVLDSVRFNTELRAKEDWLFWCELALKVCRFEHFPAPLAMYRRHRNSMTRSVSEMGRNWLRASDEIKQLLGDRFPDFLKASRTWYHQFYLVHSTRLEHRASQMVYLPTNGGHENVTAMSDGRHNKQLNKASWDATNKYGDGQVFIHRLGSAAGKISSLISIVVPIFNHFEYLRDCLTSIFHQRLRPREIVLVDDFSTDSRVRPLLKQIESQFDFAKVIFNTSNRGISYTQNIGVDAVVAPYIAFLDCDDELVPDAIFQVEDKLLCNKDTDYLFTDRIDIDERGQIIRRANYGGYAHVSESKDHKNALLDGMIASHLKVVRRTIYQQVGGCDDAYAGVQDWELALKIAEIGQLYYLPESLYRHRIHTRSVTNSERVAQFRKTNQVRRRYVGRRFAAGSGEGSILTEVRRPIPPAQLRSLYASGKRLFYSCKEKFDLTEMNFLREFNSYFEQINCSLIEQAFSLAGYLWDSRIVTLDCDPNSKKSSGDLVLNNPIENRQSHLIEWCQKLFQDF